MLDLTHLGNLFVVYGINCLGAVGIAFAGWWAAGIAERMTRRAFMASHVDVTVRAFVASLVRYAVMAVAFVLVLQVIGIQATSLVAVVGAASLAIGLALQGILANTAAGVMRLLFRPFRVGDSVEVAGRSGTVRNLNLFMTELASGDNVQVLIPNGQVWGAALTNMSAYPTRHVSISFPDAFDKHVDAVSNGVRGWLAADRRVLETPPPNVTTTNLADQTVELSAHAWTKAADAACVRADQIKQVVGAVHGETPLAQSPRA